MSKASTLGDFGYYEPRIALSPEWISTRPTEDGVRATSWRRGQSMSSLLECSRFLLTNEEWPPLWTSPIRIHSDMAAAFFVQKGVKRHLE